MFKILYVDDESELLNIGKIFLENSGTFKVDTCLSAQEAINHLKSIRYDAIISDYQMPEMDGITFLKYLRVNGDKTPFIIFTGRGCEQVVVEAFNNGVNFYLQKGGSPRVQFIELSHCIRHIIQLKYADEILRESRSILAKAMALANLVIWEFDLSTGQFMFNDQFYALYRTTAEREGGYRMKPERYNREFVHPHDRDTVAALIMDGPALANPNKEFQIEHRIIRRDGEVCDIIVRGGAIADETGRVISIFGANQDITERKRAENALRLAHHRLNLLTGITRHDIKNQIFILKGFLRLANSTLDDAEKTAGFMKQVERAVTMIEQQIAFTKEYENMGSNEPVWIEPEKVLPPSPDPEAIVLEITIQGVSIYADPMLEKVFFNLLDNSIKHGQHVTEIRVQCLQYNDGLVVIWEDNGVGVPDDEKDLIFEKGYGKNTGLGLFLVREILSITGITIRETGKHGNGARFEIFVPKGAYRFTNREETSGTI